MASRDAYSYAQEKDKGLPPFFVGLSEDRLSTFEVLNSMCLLDNYDHLLFTLECQMINEKSFAVPPFDVLLVLMTLVTVSEHYKEPVMRANDPYNTSRGKLNRRALKILRFYVRILQTSDALGGNHPDTELLRCQFFLIVDSFSSNAKWAHPHRRKRRRTESGVVYNFDAVETEEAESKGVIPNPYRAYVSCLEQKKRILGNDLLSLRLRQPGSFINMILWTLSNSLQDDKVLYIDSHEVWIPLLELIVDLFVLRHDFFLKHELKSSEKAKDKFHVVQLLSESPLANFLHLIESSQSGLSFCQCIFLSCDYKSDDLDISIELHSVYYGENTLSKTFVPRTSFSKAYKIKRSMSLRRKIIGTYCKLLTEVPTGHRLIKPKPNADELINDISDSLARFRNLEEFESFFRADNLTTASYFVPLIAEDTLRHLIFHFKRDIERLEAERLTLSLVENLDNVGEFLNEWIRLFRQGFFVPPERQLSAQELVEIKKADICMLALFEYISYLEGVAVVKANAKFHDFIEAINCNDRKRERALSENTPNLTLPRLRSLLLKLLAS